MARYCEADKVKYRARRLTCTCTCLGRCLSKDYLIQRLKINLKVSVTNTTDDFYMHVFLIMKKCLNYKKIVKFYSKEFQQTHICMYIGTEIKKINLFLSFKQKLMLREINELWDQI